ncbi:MAG: hypothetical protein PHC61_12320, partial [Chitinivibrionales bacterium]|nr:hypothetical protein [Chitinivibrionales bacterium]
MNKLLVSFLFSIMFVPLLHAQDDAAAALKAAVSEGNVERALDYYEQFRRSLPVNEKSRDITVAVIKLLIAQKEFVKAAEMVDQTIKAAGPDSVLAVRCSYYGALIALAMNKDDRAGSFFAAMAGRDITFPEQAQAL